MSEQSEALIARRAPSSYEMAWKKRRRGRGAALGFLCCFLLLSGAIIGLVLGIQNSEGNSSGPLQLGNSTFFNSTCPVCDHEATCSSLTNWTCVCNPGFLPANTHGTDCLDINECLVLSPCAENEQCINTEGSYVCITTEPPTSCANCSQYAVCVNGDSCACPPGFVGDGYIPSINPPNNNTGCTPIDHCAVMSPCSPFASCYNIWFSPMYLCFCNTGYYGDGLSCTNATCASCANITHAGCNALGQCACNTGYHFNTSNQCEDINECIAFQCPLPYSSCVNTEGSFHCECSIGFAEQSPGICRELQDCATHGVLCSYIANCSEVSPFEITCSCPSGYLGNGIGLNGCVIANYTVSPMCNQTSCDPINQVCAHIDGVDTCTCAPGFFLDIDNRCSDYNECNVLACNDTSESCENTIGSYFCHCATGFSNTSQNGCVDDNECDTSPCVSAATCINIPGSFYCNCNHGYSGDGLVSCEDINECEESTSFTNCNFRANCTNYPGGFSCQCPDGLLGNGYGPAGCNDEDVCQTGTLTCPENSQCVTIQGGGSFCVCIIGYDMINGTCVDRNECIGNTSVCSSNAQCINLPGSWRCECNPGFENRSSPIECFDIDECGINSTLCAENAICLNRIGSYDCRCLNGFTGNGFVGCTDIDECLANIDDCHVLATCINLVPGYRCQCPYNFSGEGLGPLGCTTNYPCEDASTCAENAECVFILTNTFCNCPRGYVGDGLISCNDVNECVFPRACDQNAHCNNTMGSYMCTCNQGWVSNGSNSDCYDVNECATGQHSCDTYCSNTWGSYHCSCRNGYQLDVDNRTCIDVDECRSWSTNNCSFYGTCTNEFPGYTCTCAEGYFGTGYGPTGCISPLACNDTTPCLNPSARCVNFTSLESFCECGPGFYGDGITCAYISECNHPGACHPEATCTEEVNVTGHNCTCNDGFEGDGFTCTNINECLLPNGCPPNSHCVDTYGLYECPCDPGYTNIEFEPFAPFSLLFFAACTDINECLIPGYCSPLAICANQPGTAYCVCLPGYFGTGHGPNGCVLMDSCNNSCVDPNAECVHETGNNASYCRCRDGWGGSGIECADIDECSDPLNNPCDINEGSCVNTEGSFQCNCNRGYNATTEDRHDCDDIDECVTNTHGCAPHSTCTNTPGSYICPCLPGYSGNGYNAWEFNISNCISNCQPGCTDIDECLEGTHNCSTQAFCLNTDGGFGCTCNSGYQGSGYECIPDTACVSIGNCSPNATCISTQSGGVCNCNTGFDGNGSYCSDVDECTSGDHDCDQNADCTNTFGSFTCACRYPYFVGPGSDCWDVNECATPLTNNCTICTNTWGGYSCSCPDGYSLSTLDNTTCLDVNECLNSYACSPAATCTNTVGSYNCACNIGFVGNGYECSDADECESNTSCPANSNCSNIWGNFTCNCVLGYVVNSTGTGCDDVDECTGSTHGCSIHTGCINLPGSYTCTECAPGYRNVSLFDCDDIDECTEGSHSCAYSGVCTNTPGSYTCTCPYGFSGDGYTSCTPINTCSIIPSVTNCSDNADCINLNPFFRCQCRENYYGDGFGTNGCHYIGDYCQPSLNNCSVNGVCAPTWGGFGCRCLDGYEGDGVNCTDVNECTRYNACPANSVCTNSVGSYLCTCNAGYVEDLTHNCVDVNECVTGAHNCETNGSIASCVNTLGEFFCQCRQGTTGVGTVSSPCVDIDECSNRMLNMCPCAPAGTCTNLNGRNDTRGYVCSCNPGYTNLTANSSICANINECNSTAPAPCGAFGTCIDVLGTFLCDCPIGTVGVDSANHSVPQGVSNRTVCIDQDECALGIANCANVGSSCTNTNGSFTCACISGFSGNGTVCTDVNECTGGTHTCTIRASCTNTIGSFTCSCPNGTVATNSNGTCTDVNECIATGYDNLPLHHCDPHATCTNVNAMTGNFSVFYICACNTNFTGNGYSCFPINASCATFNTSCPSNSVCQNFSGSPFCACTTGYQYTPNGTNCADINECTLYSGYSPCSDFATCSNTQGSFTCACNTGYSGNGYNCTDINECTLGTHNCSSLATCSNQLPPQLFTCNCLPGLNGSGYNISDGCQDINECLNATLNDCVPPPVGLCTNLNRTYQSGTYNCSCQAGYIGNGSVCVDQNECLSNASCTGGTLCTNILGGFYCACNTTMYWNGTQCVSPVNISNPCVVANCPVLSTCIMNWANYSIIGMPACLCDAGYGYNASTNSCTDVNECTLNTHNCNANAACLNSIGSFTCSCNSGYTGNGTSCADIDECSIVPIVYTCGANAGCLNTPGSYTCACNQGYTGNPFVNCTDIDECSNSSLNNCDPINGVCTNCPGSFSCSCPNIFFTGDGTSCTPITTPNCIHFSAEDGYEYNTSSSVFVTNIGTQKQPIGMETSSYNRPVYTAFRFPGFYRPYGYRLAANSSFTLDVNSGKTDAGTTQTGPSVMVNVTITFQMIANPTLLTGASTNIITRWPNVLIPNMTTYWAFQNVPNGPTSITTSLHYNGTMPNISGILNNFMLSPYWTNNAPFLMIFKGSGAGLRSTLGVNTACYNDETCTSCAQTFPRFQLYWTPCPGNATLC